MDQSLEAQGSSPSVGLGRLFRLNRSFDGVFEGAAPVTSATGSGHNTTDETRFTSTINWRLNTGTQCDDAQLGSAHLTAHGWTAAGEGHLAYFSGSFEISTQQVDHPPTTVCRGQIVLIASIGSHQALGEPCDPENHVEGWLSGVSENTYTPEKWIAVVVGNGLLAPGTHAYSDPAANRIIGVIQRT